MGMQSTTVLFFGDHCNSICAPDFCGVEVLYVVLHTTRCKLLEVTQLTVPMEKLDPKLLGRFRLVELQGHQRSKGHTNLVTIPAHNVPGQFLMAALDNLNFHSETEDGGNVDATTNIIYQYSKGEETADCVVRVPYDPKVRRKTIQMPEKFQLVSSHRTLKERKEAQSDHCVLMSPTDIMTAEDDSTSQHVLTCPTWTAFFELYSGKQAPKTNIGYGPMYPHTSTNPDVVKTSLDYFVSLNLKLGQSKTVITFRIAGYIGKNSRVCLLVVIAAYIFQHFQHLHWSHKCPSYQRQL
ncbi:hypothetical protein GQR58_025399 [Nymphon striatum]|nr:hypothetical protein GQR58_025399 [Nymphon striatum]